MSLSIVFVFIVQYAGQKDQPLEMQPLEMQFLKVSMRVTVTKLQSCQVLSMG